MQRHGFYSRGGGHDRWKPSRPYHVALEDSYIRAHWDEINVLCKLNGIPFNATGEKVQQDGLWCVYEFTWQLDAIQFWDRFEGRWLRGSAFHYPERPKDLPPIYATTPEEIEVRRRAFIRKWRLKHRAVADSLEGSS